MSVIEELADRLARDTIEAAERLGDEDLIAEVAKALGATSATMEEAFNTSVRVRLAEKRARRHLEGKLKAAVPRPAAE